MRSYESAMDIIFVTIDFIVGALTIPIRLIFPGLAGIILNTKDAYGGSPYWSSAIPYTKSESWGMWFWVMLLGLVVVFM